MLKVGSVPVNPGRLTMKRSPASILKPSSKETFILQGSEEREVGAAPANDNLVFSSLPTGSVLMNFVRFNLPATRSASTVSRLLLVMPSTGRIKL